jgi:hypothetical protein
MKPATMLTACVSAALLSLAVANAHAQQMSFFITSVNPGKGADFGGLAGADAYCQSLAQAVGAGNRTWRAYLSAVAAPGQPAVNARDRIGKGPWHNAKGVLIAANVEELHKNPNIDKDTGLTEKGARVNARGETPLEHDIITGTLPDGTAPTGTDDATCGNWTKNGPGSALLGHHDRMGLRDDEASRSWNSSHPSRGCDMPALRSTGSGGLIYCFAVN